MMLANCVVWLCVMIIAVLAARDDWRRMTIPDQHSLVLLILFPLAVFSPAHISFIPGILAGLVTLFLGLCLFALKQMGGGDVKLASILALYTGLNAWPRFMLLTMLAGGVLALAALYLRRCPDKIPSDSPPESWLGQLKHSPEITLPYGVAIVFGAFIVLTERLLGPVMTYYMAI